MSVDMLDGLGIGSWGFLQYLTQMGFEPNTASYSNVIPIDTSELVHYKNVYIEIKFGIKSTNSMLVVLNYGCMFPDSLCCTQTETNGNAPCSLNILYIAVCLSQKNHTGMYK